MQDIISEGPSFWGTWTLPVFLIILVLIVSGTSFIRYPDKIIAGATLATPFIRTNPLDGYKVPLIQKYYSYLPYW